MSAVEPGKIRNVAVVGHRGTGKTSLVEAMLFQAGATNRLGVVASPVLGSSLREKTKRPTRTSQSVLGDNVCVRWPKVMVGTDALRRWVASNGVTSVGL